MPPTDLRREKGFRLRDCTRGPANAGAKEAFVHPIPKALLEAGALGFVAIA